MCCSWRLYKKFLPFFIVQKKKKKIIDKTFPALTIICYSKSLGLIKYYFRGGFLFSPT